MKQLFLFLSFFNIYAYAASNLCHFEGGKAKITYQGKLASVKVHTPGQRPTYKDCRVSFDEFGKLIDCNTGNRDFMLLISRDPEAKTGSIMSHTLKIFKDIRC